MKTKDEIAEEISRLNREWEEADELLDYDKCEKIDEKQNTLKWVVGEAE